MIGSASPRHLSRSAKVKCLKCLDCGLPGELPVHESRRLMLNAVCRVKAQMPTELLRRESPVVHWRDPFALFQRRRILQPVAEKVVLFRCLHNHQCGSRGWRDLGRDASRPASTGVTQFSMTHKPPAGRRNGNARPSRHVRG